MNINSRFAARCVNDAARCLNDAAVRTDPTYPTRAIVMSVSNYTCNAVNAAASYADIGETVGAEVRWQLAQILELS